DRCACNGPDRSHHLWRPVNWTLQYTLCSGCVPNRERQTTQRQVVLATGSASMPRLHPWSTLPEPVYGPSPPGTAEGCHPRGVDELPLPERWNSSREQECRT